MANKENLNNAINVRKISKDEFKEVYFKTSEEIAVMASNLNENSTDTVAVEEEKTGKKVVTARKDLTLAQWTIKEMKRNKVGYFMIAPFMLVFTLFTLFPLMSVPP